MPIYEYQCKACGHVFDVLQKMSDDPLSYCPECGEPELRKLLSAPNFRLKGGGWYETDFKDKNKRNLAGSGDSGSGSAESGSGSANSGSSTNKDTGSTNKDTGSADKTAGD